MPINEASGLRRSNLTKEQKREAEAAIYGLKPIDHMQYAELTAQEIERMRAIVAQHDRGQRAEEFDLNNPKTAPYRYQRFPKMIYSHAKRDSRIVRSEDELQGFMELGWTDQPYPAEPTETVQLDAASAAEVEQVDRKLAELKLAELRKKR
jgi:hypothetical protein